MMVKDKKVSDPTAIANHFNDYFSNIANELQGKIYQYGHDYTDYLKQSNSFTFFLRPTETLEVQNIIDSLNTSKAIGPHSLPTDILQLIKPIVALPLVDIINLSFANGIYIENLKIAKVIPT